MRKDLMALALFLCASTAHAAEKPAELQSVIQAQTPYGSGLYTVMLLDVYEAQLWTDAPRWSWNVPFALTLNYHMNIDGSDLSQKSIDEINAQSSLSPQQLKDYKAQLAPLFPDVRQGDEITALYKPRHGIAFYHNGTYTGAISDPLLAKRFLSIWLAEKTSAPDLRQSLLALAPQ